MLNEHQDVSERPLRLLTKATQLSREFHDVGHRHRKPAIRIEGMIRRRRE